MNSLIELASAALRAIATAVARLFAATRLRHAADERAATLADAVERTNMPHLSRLEESTKIASEAHWATLGRAIADELTRGGDAAALVEEATHRRYLEQQRADRETQFAALARQIGDAHRQHRELAPLIQKIRALRRAELGAPLPDTRRPSSSASSRTTGWPD
jgi:uncharacterized GH25 family protein